MKTKPIEVRDGNTRLKIYCGKCRKDRRTYGFYTVCYYEGGRRRRRAFGSLENAKREAQRIAARLEQGERDVLKLQNSDQHSFAIAARELQATGVPLLDAVRQYVAADRALPAGGSLLEAAREYAARHQQALPRLLVAQVVDEFIGAKEQDGASQHYLRTLRYHLGPLKARFQTSIADVTASDLDAWLRGMGATARTRKNALLSCTTLFRYARGIGLLPKNVPTEAEGVPRPKRVRPGEIGIISPEELAKILHAADTDERKVYFSLAAFTGIRAAELARLDWKDISFERRHVEIPAQKAKTAARRLVPIGDALMAWLLSYADREGRVFRSQRGAERLVEWAGKQIGRWPQNALRHSYISYRVAQLQNVAQTALEAGNSPQMIHSNYLELVTPAQAQRWFSVTPAQEPGNVIAMKERAA